MLARSSEPAWCRRACVDPVPRPVLISDSRRFVFVHVSKAAGSSVVRLLGEHALPRPAPGLNSLLRLVDLPRDYHRFRFSQHGSLADVERHMPRETFAAYFKFAFVRNPFDRLVSEYNALLHKPYNRRHARVRRMGFSGYLRHEAPRIVTPQARLVTRLDGRPGLDFLGRFENFEADLAHVCDVLALPRPAQVPHTNRFGHAAYRDFYSPADRALVERDYREDLELFGYGF